MDKEKAIKGLHQHCEGSMFDRCGECPYYDAADEPFICRDMLLNDLNALLKEQDKIIQNILLEKTNELNDKVTTMQIEAQNREIRRMECGW